MMNSLAILISLEMIKKIIDSMFPEDYLTIIDNTNEDIGIKNLLNVISEVKLKEKNI